MPARSSGRIQTKSIRRGRGGATGGAGSRGSTIARSSVTRQSAVQAGTGEIAVRRQAAFTRGLGLRSKFMLVLTGLAVAVMTALGASMATTTNSFLFAQKKHDGIEIARLAGRIGAVIDARLRDDLVALGKDRQATDASMRAQLIKQAEDEVVRQLDAAKIWGVDGQISDILSVAFEGERLGGWGIGERDSAGTPIVQQFTRIYVPKLGRDIDLPDDIKVYEGTKRVAGGEIPIIRFKIALDKPAREGSGNWVRVDIAASSVVAVRNNLYTIIGIAVLVGIGLVIVVANWLAGNITRPVDLLLKDMQAVARGDLGHETRARSRDEIGVLALEFNRMTQDLKSAQSALVEQEKAAYELSLAREVQQQLLPAEVPSIYGYETATFYLGAKEVSGDYYDTFPLGNGLWGLIVADVSGKGIPGSMVMAVTRTILRLVANKHQARAAETLKETNRLMSKQIKRGMFVTAVYAVLDEASGTLTYASAGHNPMVIYRAASRSHELATTKGIAIGFNEGPVFDKNIQEAHTVLGPGDAVVIYTDGYPEAMDIASREFGEERFFATIAEFGHLDPGALIENLNAAIADHRGPADQSDDLTMIAMRRVPG